MSTIRTEQARSHDTRRAFLDAAEAALQHQSFESLSITDIAAAAKRSVGSFYTKFRDKEHLLDELVARYQAERGGMEYRTLELDKWKDKSLRETIEGISRITVDEFRERRGLFRALRYRGTPANEGGAREQMSPLYDRIAQILLLHREEIVRPKPERAVRVAFFILTSLCTNAIVFAEDVHPSTLSLSDNELVREASAAMYAYLVTQ